MNKPRLNSIGFVLKAARKKNKLSVADVRRMMKERYGYEPADKTIYGWENNTAHPTASELVCICDVYGIRDVKIFLAEDLNDLDIDSYILSADEYELVQKYRKNPYKDAVNMLLNVGKNQ